MKDKLRELAELDEVACIPANRPNLYACGWNDFRAIAIAILDAATIEQQAEWPSDALPPLPFPAKLKMGNGTSKEEHLYDADQMRQYARAALQSVRPPATPPAPKEKPMTKTDWTSEEVRNAADAQNAKGYPHTDIGDMLTAFANRIEQDERQVLDGWKLVPVEPTEKMLDAAACLWPNAYSFNYSFNTAKADARADWDAMISAAPPAPEKD